MKFLKRYSESILSNDIEEFCNDYLPYLLDDGFVCNFGTLDFGRVGLVLEKEGNTQAIQQTFKWSDVKNDFIPFLHLLNEKYDIEFIHINRFDHRGNVNVKLDHLIDDATIEDKIFRISIAFKTTSKRI